MDGILTWGIDLVVAVQQIRTPFFDSFFLKITRLGSDPFYFLLFSFLFWCVDERETARFAVLFCLAFWINSQLKRLLAQPRPYNVIPELKVGYSSGGGGLPSYHAQSSFVFWGYISLWFKKPLLYAISIILILLIAFSRIYLGRHFPTDIFGGWLIGLVLLVIFFRFHHKIEELIDNYRTGIKIAIALVIPLLFALIKPSSWTLSAMGTLSGFGVGYIIMRGYADFSASGTVVQKLMRYICGITGLIIINYGLRQILPPRGGAFFLILTFARFSLIGAWISLGAPWIFKKLNIAGIRREASQS